MTSTVVRMRRLSTIHSMTCSKVDRLMQSLKKNFVGKCEFSQKNYLRKCVQVVLTDASIEISDCLKSVNYALDSRLSFGKHLNIICQGWYYHNCSPECRKTNSTSLYQVQNTQLFYHRIYTGVTTLLYL